MIEIFESVSLRATSTAQDLLNDLVPKYDEWYNVVYDTTVPTNVTEIWVSSKIYFSLSSDSTPKIKITHINGATTTTTSTINKYSIITTDKGVMVTNNTVLTASGVWFCVGKTTDPNGVSSHGVFFDNQSGTIYEYTYTDNMTLDNYYYSIMCSGGKSRVNTVLVPVYSITGDEYFDDLMLAILTKPTDTGKVVLNDNYYYINEAVALPYTNTD